MEAVDAPRHEAAPRPPSVVVDVNEPLDLVALVEAEGVLVERRRLAPADFVVGPLAIERKSVGDFHASMIDKRLFEQVARMKETYERPALLLEGDLGFFEKRRSPRASWGALLAVAVDWGVQILPSPSKAASARLLGVLARRATREGPRGVAEVRHKPRSVKPHAEQKFCVQGLPGIGDVVSEALLERFGSVRRVYAASAKELQKVPGVGKVRAAAIEEFLDRPFVGAQRRLAEEQGSGLGA